jgi:hypothetical protein
MATKNVNSFLATGFIDLNTSDSLLGVVNGDLKRLNAGSISMLNLTARTGTFSNGSVSAVPLLNNPLSVVGSGNSYMQLNIQNRSSGTFASADLVITANNGTDNANYINLGINNSGYNDPAFTNGTGLDGYLFIDGGNLDIGTRTAGKSIEFHAGGTVAGSTIARITESGMNMVSGTYRLNNVPYNSFTMFFFHDSQTMSAGHNYFGNYQTITSATRGARGVVAPEAAVARKATWGQLLTAVGNPSLNATGYFINATTNTTGIISTVINVQSTTIPGNYYGDINPAISVSAGDLVLCSFFCPTYATTFPTAVKNSVNVYFYN